MGGELITVTGHDEVLRMLDRAPKVIVASAFVRGLAAAGEAVESALWPLVPIDQIASLNRSHGGKGALVTRLVMDVQLDADARGGTVDVGFGPLGHIALWVEYGHRMIGHKPGKKESSHSPIPAHPFMRRAADASAETAIDAFARELEKTLRNGTL